MRLFHGIPGRFARPLALLLALAATPVSAQFVFVGPASDPNCNYATVQAAVDAWAASPSTEFVSIFIANSQNLTGQQIVVPTPAASTGLNLRGDYPGCALAGTPGRATLDGIGGAAAPVIDVLGSVAGADRRFEVVLSNLRIRGGDHSGGDGGGVRVRGNVVVTIAEAEIANNAASNGGGIALLATAAGAPHLILLGNAQPALIRENIASLDGGGIYCANATVYCDRYCLIADNDAGRHGGGIGQQQCGTSLNVSKSQQPPDPDVGLRGNAAIGDGGAAWISQGSFNIGAFGAFGAAKVSGNQAGGDGGGLHYHGVGVSGGTSGIQFDNNIAGDEGGAIFANEGFLVIGAPNFSGGCKSGIAACPRFRGNSASSGGAIRLQGTADVLLSEQLMDGNSAQRGSVLDLATADNGATLTNVHVSGNSGASELILANGGYVDLRYVTIADNGGDDSALLRFDAATSLTARNTILHDDNGANTGVVLSTVAGSTLSVSCVLAHESSALAGQPGVGTLVVGDPQWEVGTNYPLGLYVPGAASDAVDVCTAGPGNIPDLLGTTRPQGVARPAGAGAFDMGAIERVVPVEIFSDGFETIVTP